MAVVITPDPSEPDTATVLFWARAWAIWSWLSAGT
jgi:hypothetical protein